MTRSVMTPYQKFREKHREEILDTMSRCVVTCNRSTIFELILRDLWVAEAVKKSLMHFDKKSWSSEQCSLNFGTNT